MSDSALPTGKTTSPTPLHIIETTLASFNQTAQVQAVYGAPILHGEVAVIPTAEVVNAMGFGVGGGSSASDAGQGTEQDAGNGGGGGGRVFARPVAAIIISGDSVRVEPIVDVTKIALAVLTAAGFIFGMWWRMSKGETE